MSSFRKIREQVERVYDHRGRLVRETTTTMGVMDSALGPLETVETHAWTDPFIAGEASHDAAVAKAKFQLEREAASRRARQDAVIDQLYALIESPGLRVRSDQAIVEVLLDQARLKEEE